MPIRSDINVTNIMQLFLTLSHPMSSLMWTMMWSFYTIGELCAQYSGLPNHTSSPEIIHGGVLVLVTCKYTAVFTTTMASSSLLPYILFSPQVYILANYAFLKFYFI